MEQGYDQYLTGLEHGDFKNSSIHMRGIFHREDKSGLELPSIQTKSKRKSI